MVTAFRVPGRLVYSPYSLLSLAKVFGAANPLAFSVFPVFRQYFIGIFFLERFYAFKNAVPKFPFIGQSPKVLPWADTILLYAKPFGERMSLAHQRLFQMIVP